MSIIIIFCGVVKMLRGGGYSSSSGGTQGVFVWRVGASEIMRIESLFTHQLSSLTFDAVIIISIDAVMASMRLDVRVA
jgi:hypothetical protein